MNLTLSLDSRQTKGIFTAVSHLIQASSWVCVYKKQKFCVVCRVAINQLVWSQNSKCESESLFCLLCWGKEKRFMTTDVVVSATPSPPVKPVCHIAETGCRGEFQFWQKNTCSNSGWNLRLDKNNHFYFLFMFKQNVLLIYFVQRNKEQIAISLLLQLNTINASDDLKTTIISGFLAQRIYLSLWLVCPLKDKV